MDQEKIGKFIAELRREKNMTQEALAEKLGVTDKSVSRWENGKSLPDYSILAVLCKELGVSINELLSAEKLKKEEYQEKLEENIINLTIDSKKEIRKKLKILGIFSCLFITLIIVANYIYKSYALNVRYDARTMKCFFKDNTLTYTIAGTTILNTNYMAKIIDNTKYVIFHSTITMDHQQYRNWEYKESLASVINNGNSFGFRMYIDLEKNANPKVLVYYTNKSLKKLEKLNDEDFLKEIEHSFLMCSKEEA